jgi:hypothetical protein
MRIAHVALQTHDLDGRRNSNAEHSVLRSASRTTVGGVSVSTATIRPSLPWQPLYPRYPARSCRSANDHYPPKCDVCRRYPRCPLTSTPIGRFAQKAVIPRRLGERVKSTRSGGFHPHDDWAVNNAKRKLCFDAPPRLPRKEGSRWQPRNISQFIGSQPGGAAPSGLSQLRPANSLASASMKTRTFAARCRRCG